MCHANYRSIAISIAAATLAAVGWHRAALSDDIGQNYAAKSINYATVELDATDNSFFGRAEIPFELKDFAPPAGPIGVGAMQPAKSLVFTTLPGGWDGEWHPAPRRQFVIVLGGAVEIEVADGSVRRFSDGDIMLLEDIRGRGHDTRVVSDEPALFAIVALPEPE